MPLMRGLLVYSEIDETDLLASRSGFRRSYGGLTMSEEKIEVKRSSTAFWFACVDIDVLEDERLTPIEKVVFCLLCRYASLQNREAFPSIKNLAQKANCSDRSVMHAIKRLVELGLIERQERFINGRQTTSLYKIVGFESMFYGERQKGEGEARSPRPENNNTGEGENNDTPYNDNSMNDILPYGENEFSGSDSPDENHKTESESQNQNQNQNQNQPEPLTASQKPEREQEIYGVEDVPSGMQETAEFLLMKTKRKGLTADEISALYELNRTQKPARVQKQITTVVKRFQKQNKPLTLLNFVYIAACLRHQPTLNSAKPQPRNQNPEVQELTPITNEARLAELEAKFDEEGRRK